MTCVFLFEEGVIRRLSKFYLVLGNPEYLYGISKILLSLRLHLLHPQIAGRLGNASKKQQLINFVDPTSAFEKKEPPPGGFFVIQPLSTENDISHDFA